MRAKITVLFSVIALVAWQIPMSTAYAAGKGVAKVIIMKGKVKAKTADGKVITLKRGMWLPEGAVVQTAKKSFTKLLFIDKSSMNVGPGSKMKISKFPKNDAGVIQLLKGQIRSKVTKNYMEMGKKNKSKLFIKTKTAAMGVRGTDFIVGFNPTSQATSLDVVSGAVAMAAMDGNIVDQAALEQAVSSNDAVMVEKGFQTKLDGGATKPPPPAPIPQAKLENLKVNENSTSQSSTLNAPAGAVAGAVIGGGDDDSAGDDNQNQSNDGVANADNNDGDSNTDGNNDSKAEGDKPKGPIMAVLPPGVDPDAFDPDAAPEGEDPYGGGDPNREPASIPDGPVYTDGPDGGPEYLPPPDPEFEGEEFAFDEQQNPCEVDPCGNCGIACAACLTCSDTIVDEDDVIVAPQSSTVQFNITIQ